ncbi:partial Glutathione-binding protein GsiB, partial [Anaerolineae bacterium]
MFRSALARMIVGLAIVILVVACAAPTAAPAPTSVPAPVATSAPVATAAPPSAATSVPAPTSAPAPTTAPTAAPAAAATNFRIAIGVDMDTLDPVQLTTTTVANVLDYMAETLTTIDQNGKLLPQLAKSWDISADGLTYTFKLQEGVKFHDGQTLNAAAVKANLDRLLDPDIKVTQRSS